ncbi:MAG: SurA N-terminal domain-containing protein [Methyloceanibacter sp.]|uniref:SurA N-terminal domain-containing protein n=1 Tax=Methyloceanibacter sp. TaxID=1965321 RepID=UPI003D6D7045
MTRTAMRLARGAGLIAALVIGTGIALTQEVSIKVLVNDDPISDYDIDQRERFLAITTQEEPGPALKKKATDLLIDERLQMQEGRKLGFTPDEDEVNKILGDMAQKNKLDIDGLAAALGKAGVNIKTLKDRIRAQLVWQDVVRRKFAHTIQIGEIDVDRALADSPAESDAGGETQTTIQLRQVKFSLPSNADQRTIAARLAAAEVLRAKFTSCANVADLAKGVDGATIKTLQDQQAATIAQPARLLVTNAKVGQMTPPTLSTSGVELYAVCGKRSIRGDTKVREQTQRKLMNEEMMIQAERLLRDLRQDAFIEYR